MLEGKYISSGEPEISSGNPGPATSRSCFKARLTFTSFESPFILSLAGK